MGAGKREPPGSLIVLCLALWPAAFFHKPRRHEATKELSPSARGDDYLACLRICLRAASSGCAANHRASAQKSISRGHARLLPRQTAATPDCGHARLRPRSPTFTYAKTAGSASAANTPLPTRWAKRLTVVAPFAQVSVTVWMPISGTAHVMTFSNTFGKSKFLRLLLFLAFDPVQCQSILVLARPGEDAAQPSKMEAYP